MAALSKAESSVRAATNAKIETIRAIEHHIQTIRVIKLFCMSQ